MNFLDMLALGFENLWKSKLRTFLTTLGVVIGIGALTSMVSFGTGMQKNVTESFKENDLFTTIMVTPPNIDLQTLSGGSVDIEKLTQKSDITLNDSILAKIKEIDNVECAYPEINFPVKVRLLNKEYKTSLRALPAEMGNLRPFNKLEYGAFFDTDSAEQCVITWHLLEKMEFTVLQDAKKSEKPDSVSEANIIYADSLIGKDITVLGTTVDYSNLFQLFPFVHAQSGNIPVKTVEKTLKITGIVKNKNSFSNFRFGRGILVPLKTGQKIPHLGLTSLTEIINTNQLHSYTSVWVRVRDMKKIDEVNDKIKNMGLNTFAISDQLDEIKKSFMIMDGLLGAVGTIALLISALGIINTMVMSIMERTREIGIMKAIGGSDKEIKLLFFLEAGAIGTIGAIFGLLLGWIFTRIANLVLNSYFIPKEVEHVELFYFPLWLVLGAVCFSIIISLLAGMYPAMRAAKVDPVVALRHD